jgi:hypothetical protein
MTGTKEIKTETLGKIKPVVGDVVEMVFPKGAKLMNVRSVEQYGCVMSHVDWQCHKYFYGWAHKARRTK